MTILHHGESDIGQSEAWERNTVISSKQYHYDHYLLMELTRGYLNPKDSRLRRATSTWASSHLPLARSIACSASDFKSRNSVVSVLTYSERGPRSTESLLGELQLCGFKQAAVVDALEGNGRLQLLLQARACLS